MGFKDNGDDPTTRRRVDAEAQRNRDAEMARMRAANVPFRVIADRLGVSLGCVQKSVRRAQKLADAIASGSPGDVIAALDDGLSADDVRCAADVARLGGLERYRLRFMPTEQGRAERTRVTAERKAERQRFAVEHAAEIARDGFARAWDGHNRVRVTDGTHWREHCDAAGDDSGTDRDADDW